ncbi:hypothetical protein R3P38DRAFT_162617 [Favolaschia claudopus]|uniref:Malate dehydrogenase n=1 Tax=Favolaschia claudopus TaxID=2862362 RepID=A0AAW0CVZ9_9AGAR
MFSAMKLLSVLSSAALLVSAAPAAPKVCDASAATMNLPAGQSLIVAPTTGPKFVALGVGVQNYTCDAATSKYTSVGAVASLFDISCLVKTPAFANIQTVAQMAWSVLPPKVSATTIGEKLGAPALLGFHYFIPNPITGTGLSPKWDFTSTGKFKGDASAFIVAAKAANIAAPQDSAKNVDWLMLNNVQGSLATQVFRVDTVNGQPPTSCTPGSANISVKYTSKYFLY